MESGERLCIFDLETGGLDPARHPVIQFAAVAVDHEWAELEALEVKVEFDPALAEADALAANSYEPEAWTVAVEPHVARRQVDEFFRRHATLRKRGKMPPHREYTVARVCAHNARFDAEFLGAWFKAGGMFLPAASFEALDSLALSRWHALSLPPEARPENHKLGTLCQRYGIEHAGEHDALADVRATAALCRFLLTSWGDA